MCKACNTPATFSTEQLIAAVKRHANQYYESDGWDYVIESYTDSEIAAIVSGSRTPAMAIARVKKHVAPLAEMRDDVRAASGEY